MTRYIIAEPQTTSQYAAYFAKSDAWLASVASARASGASCDLSRCLIADASADHAHAIARAASEQHEQTYVCEQRYDDATDTTTLLRVACYEHGEQQADYWHASVALDVLVTLADSSRSLLAHEIRARYLAYHERQHESVWRTHQNEYCVPYDERNYADADDIALALASLVASGIVLATPPSMMTCDEPRYHMFSTSQTPCAPVYALLCDENYACTDIASLAANVPCSDDDAARAIESLAYHGLVFYSASGEWLAYNSESQAERAYASQQTKRQTTSASQQSQRYTLADDASMRYFVTIEAPEYATEHSGEHWQVVVRDLPDQERATQIAYALCQYAASGSLVRVHAGTPADQCILSSWRDGAYLSYDAWLLLCEQAEQAEREQAAMRAAKRAKRAARHE